MSFGSRLIYNKTDFDIRREEPISDLADIEKCVSQATSFFERRT
ncbi:MAG TPA: hypothetical protein VG758_16160 [Hyphomicrobiaceae bacterium]|jgi:hypothetical protein|nr:hypothetical protein [Hyphomicrobiaceae bacterium]